MEDRANRRWSIALGMALAALMACVGVAAWWWNRSSALTEPVVPATPIPATVSSATTADGLRDADGEHVASRQAITASIEQAPEDHQPSPQPEQRKISGIGILVRDLRYDLGKLHERKLYGTGARIVKRALYLREDMLGNSLSMDEPIPKGWLDRHESYTAFAGPNGGRVFSFSREQYPLFYEMMERKDQDCAAVLDDDLIERMTLLAEDSITLSGVPPR